MPSAAGLEEELPRPGSAHRLSRADRGQPLQPTVAAVAAVAGRGDGSGQQGGLQHRVGCGWCGCGVCGGVGLGVGLCCGCECVVWVWVWVWVCAVGVGVGEVSGFLVCINLLGHTIQQLLGKR